MGSRAFISCPVPEELLVTQTPFGVDVAIASRSAAAVALAFFVLFPLALLPLAIYGYNINHTGEGLPPVDILQLWKEPAAFFATLPDNKTFRIYAALPWVLAVLLFTKHVFRALRRPRMTVTAEGVTLAASFPTSSSERLDLSAVPEVHIRAYMNAKGYTPQLMHFIALPAGEGIFDFLVGIEKSNDEGLLKLYTIADAMARLHSKPLKQFDADGKEVERKP